METLYVVGHATPDTDSIISAIAVSELYKALGYNAIPARQGVIAPETQFVLTQTGLKEPMLLHDVADKDVVLVDFSDIMQAPQNIKMARIHAIIDHHKLGDITTNTPLEMWVRPFGCTATIVYEMYTYYKIPLNPAVATAMLFAILSDTVLFKSVTTTKKDKDVVAALQKITGIEDPIQFGMEMFIAKSDIRSASPHDLIHRDYKTFSMNGKKIGIGQLEVVDASVLDHLHEDFIDTLQKMKKTEGYHSLLFFLTDILKEGSFCFCVSEQKEGILEVFGVPNEAIPWLPGVMSRKKQVVPLLEKFFVQQ